MSKDQELLREYSERHSEDAFRALVDRHVGLVHGVARRQTRDEHLAEEVTQAVFILFARKASTLKAETLLAGWFYRTTRFVALHALRTERRRQFHEGEFATMDTTRSDSVWEQVSPHLEEVMSRLGETDRNAVVLRFFQGRSFAEVAQALGTTEAAAKMRVSRTIEKLRGLFGRRGITVPSAMLAAALTAHGVHAAPVGLAANVTSVALSQSHLATASALTLVIGATKLMAWNKVKTVIAACIVALLLGGGVTIMRKKAEDAPATAKLAITTFQPLEGEWEGAFDLRVDDREPVARTVLLIIRSKDAGRLCEIDMRVEGQDGTAPLNYTFSHSLVDAGERVFTISDPKTGRGDGEGFVTESFHNPAVQEWKAAIRFPFTNDRGSMDGLWHRKGDDLRISSHDQFFVPDGTNHVFADMRLRRRASASPSTASR